MFDYDNEQNEVFENNITLHYIIPQQKQSHEELFAHSVLGWVCR